MQGIFLDAGTVTDGDVNLEPLSATLDAWSFNTLTPAAEIADTVRNAHVVVCNKAVMDRRAIAAAGDLQLICIAATGTNNVDLEAARAGNIAVCNVNAYATHSVVEHVFMLILALNRRLPEYTRAIDTGQWQRAQRFSMLDFPFRELAGRTLGIIGYGELGRAVAGVGRAFGMEIAVAERRGQPARPGRHALEQVLETADIISLHCPLTTETENLLDAEAFRRMRQDAMVINTSRGGIVNEPDLLHALDSGEIAAAGIDVLTTEPPAMGNVLLEAQRPNLIVTPHIAWAGQNARQRLVDEVAENIRAFLDGNPRNRVI